MIRALCRCVDLLIGRCGEGQPYLKEEEPVMMKIALMLTVSPTWKFLEFGDLRGRKSRGVVRLKYGMFWASEFTLLTQTNPVVITVRWQCRFGGTKHFTHLKENNALSAGACAGDTRIPGMYYFWVISGSLVKTWSVYPGADRVAPFSQFPRHDGTWASVAMALIAVCAYALPVQTMVL